MNILKLYHLHEKFIQAECYFTKTDSEKKINKARDSLWGRGAKKSLTLRLRILLITAKLLHCVNVKLHTNV